MKKKKDKEVENRAWGHLNKAFVCSTLSSHLVLYRYTISSHFKAYAPESGDSRDEEIEGEGGRVTLKT